MLVLERILPLNSLTRANGHLHGGAILIALGLLLLPLSNVSAQADPFAPTRQQFLKAYAAVKPGAQPPEQPGDEALKTYPLYPYLQAARIQRALAAATGGIGAADNHATSFLEYYGNEPVAAGVRRAWLASLATRKQWTTFLSLLPEESPDPQTRCQALVARLETGQTDGLEEQAIQMWLTADQLPPVCEQIFVWLRERNALTPELVERRVRLILEKGSARFARIIARPLPAARAAPLLQWAALIEQPRQEIDALIASPAKPVEPQALLDGWTRLVRSGLEDARARHDRLITARKLDRKEASPLSLALALRLSWNRHPETLQYFNRVSAEAFDDTSLEWYARAALWNGEWQTAATAIGLMSETQRESARWRYWAARAAQQQGNRDTARRLYVSVLGFDNYYSAMAAARLDQPFTPNPVSVAADDAELKRITALPPFVRSRELLLAGMRGEAYTEWQYGFRELPEAVRPQVVHLGMQWGWYDVAIATATQQRIFEDYSLLYPRPFDTAVQTAAKQSGLPPELVYGVMRQESLYRADAVSSAGALGLLQLLPETARITARRWNHASPARADLLNPATNVRLGAAHLKDLITRYRGQIPIALAGYNAGPNAAQRWLPEKPLDVDIWIENIPYNETRTYVQRILWHSLVFSWLGSGQPQDTRHWLTEVSRSET